jgi:hypothetical protein
MLPARRPRLMTALCADQFSGAEKQPLAYPGLGPGFSYQYYTETRSTKSCCVTTMTPTCGWTAGLARSRSKFSCVAAATPPWNRDTPCWLSAVMAAPDVSLKNTAASLRWFSRLCRNPGRRGCLYPRGFAPHGAVPAICLYHLGISSRDTIVNTRLFSGLGHL